MEYFVFFTIFIEKDKFFSKTDNLGIIWKDIDNIALCQKVNILAYKYFSEYLEKNVNLMIRILGCIYCIHCTVNRFSRAGKYCKKALEILSYDASMHTLDSILPNVLSREKSVWFSEIRNGTSS